MLDQNPGTAGAEASPIQVSLSQDMLHSFIVQQVSALARRDELNTERLAATNWLGDNAIKYKDTILSVLLDTYLKHHGPRDGIIAVWRSISVKHPDIFSEVVDSFLLQQQKLFPHQSRAAIFRAISETADHATLKKLGCYLNDSNRSDSDFIAECIRSVEDGGNDILFNVAVGDNKNARSVVHRLLFPNRQSKFPLEDIRLDVLLYVISNPNEFEDISPIKLETIRAQIVQRGMEDKAVCTEIVRDLSENVNSSVREDVVAGSEYVLARLKPMGVDFLISVSLNCDHLNQLSAFSALLNANKEEPIRDSILKSIGLMDPNLRRDFIKRALEIEGYIKI